MMRGIRIQLELEDREKLIADLNEVAGFDLFETTNMIQQKHRTKEAPFHVYVEELSGENVRCFLSDSYMPRFEKVWNPLEVVAYVRYVLFPDDNSEYCPSCYASMIEKKALEERINKQSTTIESQQKLIDKLMGDGDD